MTNSNELRAELVRHGDTLISLAKKLNITTVSLSLKLNGKRDFKQCEIAKIKELYELTNDRTDVIFFSPVVSCQET